MIRPICKDTILLSKPAEPATNADLPVARDLADTLLANRQRCVGMAANMIGVPKNIIAVPLFNTLNLYPAGNRLKTDFNPCGLNPYML